MTFYNVSSACNCHINRFLSFISDGDFKHCDFKMAVVQNPSRSDQHVVIQFLGAEALHVNASIKEWYRKFKNGKDGSRRDAHIIRNCLKEGLIRENHRILIRAISENNGVIVGPG